MCNKHGMFCLETFFIDCVLSFKMCIYLCSIQSSALVTGQYFPPAAPDMKNAVIFLQF